MTTPEAAPKLIAYYRVSTKAQGSSGLGLEGQVAAVATYAKGIGADIVRSYEEVESGKRSDRDELRKALSDCKRSKAKLVIAKLDRLSRNVAFLANLLESRVKFVACDNPHANNLTVHILAAVAEDEAERISERTKTALAAYKAGSRVSKRIRTMYPDGVPDAVVEATAGKLGASLAQCRNLNDQAGAKGRLKAVAKIKEKTDEAYSDLAPIMKEWRDAGNSLESIAHRLNCTGHTTRRGKLWNRMQVMRVLDRHAD